MELRQETNRVLKQLGKVWTGKKNIIKVPIEEGTVPYEVEGHFGAGRVLIKPASLGTGVIAGGAARAVFEAAGVHNILSKCLGSNNPHNVVKATFDGLMQLKSPQEIISRRGVVE
jgi:small subunit ribosomal protein S5